MTPEFGATAWGLAWLKRIESGPIAQAPDRDLPRARTLARHDLDRLTIDGPHVTACVTERGREHRITLQIPTWNRQEQRIVARVVGHAEPSWRGDLPDHLVDELIGAGVHIAPRLDDIHVTSETAAARRHVLAICYALVQRIDEEPQLAVSLRTATAEGKPQASFQDPDLIALVDINPETFHTAVTPA